MDVRLMKVILPGPFAALLQQDQRVQQHLVLAQEYALVGELNGQTGQR